MFRLFQTAAAIAASSSLAYGIAPGLERKDTLPQPGQPIVVGADKPVFLGRMVITAAALPPE
ncbi:hypothetical protein [Novosphingobium sp. KA1]|uniref:hypothetical protein n=1 Tax=Novosphingobium sp. (strain KA1) TaxID=164608 RepID=UPI001A8DEA90|nr:hypothetical protein [Novosphingobium sp. KA1]QSR16753.1 hypothetical protein CA833_06050 [Novosphingobium sp. KA1]